MDREVERQIPVRELNQRTSAVLREVASGVAVTITSGGRPVARLVPITCGSTTLDRFVAMGQARAPSVSGPVAMPPAYDDERTDVAAALTADRDDERF